jgi:chemotaxis protein MotB
MARKKYQEEPDHHDRWLVSYADFITLLFAFFVVMYAISSLNEGKYRVLSNALTGAFGRVMIQTPRQPEKAVDSAVRLDPLPVARQNTEVLRREREHMTGMARDILAVLEPLVREGKVKVTQTSRGVTIDINASVLFPSGEAKLSADSSQALRAIASVLKDDNHAIQVEGHTDNLPIKNSVFPSNWELSAVRASTVVRLFAESGIEDARMTAVGQGPKQPVGSNDTADGRARNRRVTITILAILPDNPVDVPVSQPDATKPSN